ncbi:hypothetical protein AAU61_02825 [Desulfocarbo indianensis]|nr:hypothetical protein AAU61_02825 [Desulfocarbo indianensis]
MKAAAEARYINKPWRLMAVALAMLLMAACAATNQFGPDAPLVRVRIDGYAQPMAPPETAGEVTPVRWDWGLYLVEAGGDLRKLSELNGTRTTVLIRNPLSASGEFRVPPGRHTVRLLVEAYQYYYIGLFPAPQSLLFFQRDYRLDLAPGQRGEIRARPGGPPPGEPPAD